MANSYRVDRNNEIAVPCGMNSVRYIGDDRDRAYKAFADTDTGRDWWGRPDSSYGIVLSKWDDAKREYVVLNSRGF